MTLILLKYVLPLLTGYAIFLSISGRFQPFRKPILLKARPSWLLGLWFGLSVAFVALLTMQMVNPLAFSEVKAASPASMMLLTLLIVPGIVVYFWYQTLLNNLQTMDWQNNVDQTDFSLDSIDYLEFPNEPKLVSSGYLQANHESFGSESRYELDETLSANAEQIPSDEVYDSAFEREYDRLVKASNVVEATEKEGADEYTTAFDMAQSRSVTTAHAEPSQSNDSPPTQVIPAVPAAIEELTAQSPFDTESYQLAFDHWHSIAVGSIEQPSVPVMDSEEYISAFDNFRQRSIESVAALRLIEAEARRDSQTTLVTQELENTELETARIEALMATELLSREREMKAEYDLLSRKAIQAKEAETESAITEAHNKTRQANKLRQETETHLRITRRALSKLESEARRAQNSKSDELIELEQELEERIKIAAKAESALVREQKLRSDVELQLMQSKQSILAARKDARKNTAARAKVLATANKAIEFARHTVDARSKVETDLQKLKEQVKIHQATISSLIDTLDREKSQFREEVSYLSKQLMQKEIELEKKSIGTGNLTSRLVKKVARAKTVTRVKSIAG